MMSTVTTKLIIDLESIKSSLKNKTLKITSRDSSGCEIQITNVTSYEEKEIQDEKREFKITSTPNTLLNVNRREDEYIQICNENQRVELKYLETTYNVLLTTDSTLCITDQDEDDEDESFDDSEDNDSFIDDDDEENM